MVSGDWSGESRDMRKWSGEARESEARKSKAKTPRLKRSDGVKEGWGTTETEEIKWDQGEREQDVPRLQQSETDTGPAPRTTANIPASPSAGGRSAPTQRGGTSNPASRASGVTLL